jgi:phage tail-like protein
MAPMRPFALLRTRDQWLRAGHAHTDIDPETGGVQLARMLDPAPSASTGATVALPAFGAGLAFDSSCRLYHSLPDAGRVERILWAARDPIGANPAPPEPVDLFEAAAPAVTGDFRPEGEPDGPLRRPRGLAVDDEDRLFVAEAGSGQVLVFDLFGRRLLRRASIRTVTTARAVPLDVAVRGGTVWVLAWPFALLRMGARTGPVPVEVDGIAGAAPTGAIVRRIAIAPDGNLALLARAAAGSGAVVFLRWSESDEAGQLVRRLVIDHAIDVTDGTDIEFGPEGELVVARGPGEDFRRWRDSIEDAPLKGRDYDGLGIVRTPDGRIGFWTARGFRHAVVARPQFVGTGRVSTYALDSGAFQTVWGRLFLDACIPEGTDLRVHFATRDELPDVDEPTLPRTPPDNTPGVTVRHAELSPPLAPISLAPPPGEPGLRVFRRPDGREIPWSRPAPDDPFMTFDVPVNAPAGRYLWITLDMRSGGRATPRVKCLRAERPGHDLLRRLPRLYSREAAAAAFLQRYLAVIDGMLVGLDDRSAERRALIDPASAPEELLPWLADFVGLVLDERWPVARRRALIAAAAELFRRRGTVPGLLQFMELCLGVRPVIIERFRLRGLGGAILGNAEPPPASAPILGAGFRIGGAVGDAAADVSTLTADAFATNAHRFSVMIPASLTDDELAATAHLLDVHRPAHTIVEVCTIAAGMRVGAGLHVGLSSMIGRSGGWQTLQVGSTALGTTAVIGRAGPGVVAGSSVLGGDSRVG